MEEIVWHWYAFEELSGGELYAILKLRQQIFVVEQQCAYQDCDDLDLKAWHLVGWQHADTTAEPVAYLRVIIPESPREMPVIGRLLIHPACRGRGTAGLILSLALNRIEEFYPAASVKIAAQYYLFNFYRKFGFIPASEVFDEDGIPHITMIRPPS